MSDEQQALKVFLNNARERASLVLNEEHIGADVKSVIKDLLQVSDSFSTLMVQNVGQSSDVRVLKKKFDQAKGEIRNLTTKLEAFKKAVLPIVDAIKVVSAESGEIAKRHATSTQDPDLQSAARIRAAAQQMVALIVQLGS